MTSTMSPIDWAKRPIEKYAAFSGRAPRAEYWWYTLAVIVASVVVSMIEGLLGIGTMVAGLYGPLTLLLMLALIVPGLAVTARRLHDTGRSGWWMLIAVIPYLLVMVLALMAVSSGSMGGLASAGLLSIVAFIGAIALLVFLVLPSNPGENRFGPNPYGEGSGGAVPA